MKEIDSNDVDRAFKHLQMVAQIHSDATVDESADAIQNVFRSYGMDVATQKCLNNHIRRFTDDDGMGWLKIGVLLGVAIASD